jgi:four helix bundle protein
MTESVFDHERLDVYRLAIEYVVSSYRIAKSINGAERHARDQWVRAAQSIPLNIAEGNGKQSLKDKNRFFEIARGSVLECAAIHDMLLSFKADTISEGSIEYEKKHEQCGAPMPPPVRC